MIVLTVLSYNGAPATGPACTFDELGGTVGRADSNQLVLPDPERTISRVHARVVCKAGRYAVVDNGSNPISVNGKALGTGKEHPLVVGDRVQIGGYVLAVSQAAAGAASSDPFADLFGDAAMGLAVPKPVPAPVPGRAPMQPPAPAPRASPPPMMAPAAAAPFPPAPLSSAPLARGYIPADWDPFAAQLAPAVAQAATAAPGADLLFDLPMARPDTLDALFDLSASPAVADPLAVAPADPLGASAAQVLQLQPNTAAHADPLQSFGLAAAAPPASQSDHASELHTPMPLPPPAPRVRPQPVPQPVPQPSAQPAGAVFSWDNPPTDGRVVTLPGARAAAAVAAPAAQPSAPPAGLANAAAAAPDKANDPANSNINNHDELLSALLQGLDAPGLRLERLDAATLRLLGQLLRESLRGTVELLIARTALKREMRAQMTMIVPRENNPLKFSPTVEAALQHLLGPPTKGFMPPVQAVRDACDDLRAHQLGVMAGMRAALEGVLQRFDPQLLEAQLTRKSTLESLIPATRKARLWELFQELYSQLQREAQDDFDDLFGKAFLRAYEDQLDRLQGEPGPR